MSRPTHIPSGSSGGRRGQRIIASRGMSEIGCQWQDLVGFWRAYLRLSIWPRLLTLPDSSNTDLSIVIQCGPCLPDVSWDASKVQSLEGWVGVELKVPCIFIDIVVSEDAGRCARGIRVGLDETIRHSPRKAVPSIGGSTYRR